MIMVAFCVFALFGLLGLAFDLGRMYIHKSEAMTYVDAAAVAAARELDGTAAGGSRATAAAQQSWARWNFSSSDFSSPVIEFSTSKAGPWSSSPATWASVAYARVTATVTGISLAFLPVVGTASAGSVAHLAVAGQIPSIPQAVFPFSPVAHADAWDPASLYALPANQQNDGYGFFKGGKYTFRWPNDPTKNNAQICPNDNNSTWINKVDASSNGWRGYITDHSASVIADEIKSDLMGRGQVPALGELVTEYGGNGNKGGDANAMDARVQQDTDRVTTEYFYSGTKNAAIGGGAFVTQNSDSYLWRQQQATPVVTPIGNNRRVVTVLVNAGYNRSDGTSWATLGHTPNLTLGYAQFFLYDLSYDASQNHSFCAEYIGNSPCTGCTGGTAIPGDGSTAYIIRLVE
jgi:hypothetical protein